MSFISLFVLPTSFHPFGRLAVIRMLSKLDAMESGRHLTVVPSDFIESLPDGKSPCAPNM